MLRFVIIFIFSLALLFTLSLYTPVERVIIAPITLAIAWSSACLMHLFDSQVVSEGDMIRNSLNGFGIQVVRGCNAIDAVLILTAAMLAFRSPWKYKLLGIGLGFIAIQLLNLVRIISLFYLGQWNQLWFQWFHLYLWQALIVMDTFIVWLLWLRYLPRGNLAAAMEEINTKQE